MSVKQSREERLAEKLRENLRRRKAQARVLAQAGPMRAEEETASPLPKPERDG